MTVLPFGQCPVMQCQLTNSVCVVAFVVVGVHLDQQPVRTQHLANPVSRPLSLSRYFFGDRPIPDYCSYHSQVVTAAAKSLEFIHDLKMLLELDISQAQNLKHKNFRIVQLYNRVQAQQTKILL